MIQAQATVERVVFRSGTPAKSMFRVHVSDPSHPHQRNYTLIAENEDDAAHEGIRRFCDELDPTPTLPEALK